MPISPTYDRNEFDQIYNKESHKNSFFEFLSKFHQILDLLKCETALQTQNLHELEEKIQNFAEIRSQNPRITIFVEKISLLFLEINFDCFSFSIETAR